MIPKHLSFAAFGPYLNKQEIDFFVLQDAGLFLISGETGAGKTAILDAMTYALFGASSGDTRGDIAAMRSGFAPPDVPTAVEFVFMAGGREYKFTRGVAVHTKRSGEQELRITQNAFFKNEAGAFEPFFENPKIKNVKEKAEEILGLTCDQFRQVVLLPQGQFERLLVSDSGEKEQMLSTLFHAEQWEGIVRRLSDMAAEMRRSIDVRETAAQGVLLQYGCETPMAMEEEVKRRKSLLNGLEKTRVVAAEREGKARDIHAKARALNDLFTERDMLRKQREQLEGKQAAFGELEHSLVRAAAAAKLRPWRDAAGVRKAEMAERQQRLEQEQASEEKAQQRFKQAAGMLRGLYGALIAETQKLEKRKEEQEAQAQQAKEDHARLFEQYIGSMAHILSEQLEEGQPCPVCGSTHHVRKAENAEPVRAEDLKRSETEMEQINRSVMETERAIAEKARDVTECEAELQNLPEVEAAEPRGDMVKIIAEWRDARQGVERLREQAKASETELAAAQERYEKSLAEYKAVCQEHGFETSEQVRQSSLKEEEVAERRERLEQYKVQSRTVQARLMEAEAKTAEATPPDFRAIEAEMTEAVEAAQKANKAYAEGKADADLAENAYQGARKELDALVAEKEEFRELDQFSKLLRGDMGVGIKRYVLGVMLSSVTGEANHLLKLVHDGRYALYRTMEGAGRARKVGLDLEVFDRNTGERRSVNSLSGGEKFLVSLALSLGLSAVVQAQSGGIRIDAMFIDEGFGALDPGSISDALDILAGVRGGSRMVGIISHVRALQESISASINVKKTRWGSELSVNR